MSHQVKDEYLWLSIVIGLDSAPTEVVQEAKSIELYPQFYKLNELLRPTR